MKLQKTACLNSAKFTPIAANVVTLTAEIQDGYSQMAGRFDAVDGGNAWSSRNWARSILAQRSPTPADKASISAWLAQTKVVIKLP